MKNAFRPVQAVAKSAIRPAGVSRLRLMLSMLLLLGALIAQQTFAASADADSTLTVISGEGSSSFDDKGEQAGAGNVSWVATYATPEVATTNFKVNRTCFNKPQTYVANTTRGPIGYQVFWVPAGIDCSTVSPDDKRLYAGGAIQAIGPKKGYPEKDLSTFPDPIPKQPIAGVIYYSKPVVVPPVTSAVNFTGGGDGYEVIHWHNNLYVLNHHNSNGAKCYDARTGNPGCEDGTPAKFDWDFKPIDNLGYYKPHQPSHMIVDDKLLYVVIRASGTEAGVLCQNLATKKGCGFSPMGVNGSTTTVGGFGQWGGKLYFHGEDGGVVCVDGKTQLRCEGWPVSVPYTSGNVGWGSSVVYDDYIISTYARATTVSCFKISTKSKCNGWGGDGIPVGADPKIAAPLVDGNGVVVAGCTNYGCYSVNGGAPVSAPAFTAFLTRALNSTYSGFSSGVVWFDKDRGLSRYYAQQSPTQAGCFDFVTNTTCGLTTAAQNTRGLSTYTVTQSYTIKSCFWIYGDASVALGFDGLTMGACGGNNWQFTVIESPADSYVFDPNIGNKEVDPITWRTVVLDPKLIWGKHIANEAQAVKVEIFSEPVNGVGESTLVDTRFMPQGKYSMSIADLSFEKYPKLRIVITIKPVSYTIDPPEGAGANVLWDGPPVQFSIQTTPEAGQCVISGSVSGGTTETGGKDLGGSLSDSNALVDKNDPAGFGISPSDTLSLGLADDDKNPLVASLYPKFDQELQLGDLVSDTINTATFKLKASGKFSDEFTYNKEQYWKVADGAGLASWRTADLKSSLFSSYSPAVQRGFNTSPVLDTKGNIISVRSDTKGPARIDYLLGNRLTEALTDETRTPLTPFRKRGVRKEDNQVLPVQYPMGMIISSGVSILERVNLGGLDTIRGGPGYDEYVTDKTYMREKPLAVAQSNDGFLHGVTFDKSGTKEVQYKINTMFHFMPWRVTQRISAYTDRTRSQINYDPFFLDNTPLFADIDTANGNGAGNGSSWRTVVVAAHGRMTPGYYAADVGKAPENVQALWTFDELSAPNEKYAKEVGQMLGQQVVAGHSSSYSRQVVKVKAGNGYRWAFVAGNGINSVNGNATLFIIYFDSVINGIPKYDMLVLPKTDRERAKDYPNGLFSPLVIDNDGDSVADTVYVGDRNGNMWKINIADPTRLAQLNNNIVPMFSADIDTKLARPRSIIGAPVVSFRPEGRVIVFGTGALGITPLRYYDRPGSHSIYGIIDRSPTGINGVPPSDTILPGNLKKRTLKDITYTDSLKRQQSGKIIDGEAIDLKNDKGWFIDVALGEAFVANAFKLASLDEVRLISVVPPSENPCGPGSAMLYSLNSVTGLSGLGIGNTDKGKTIVGTNIGRNNLGANSTGNTSFNPYPGNCEGVQCAPLGRAASTLNAGRVMWTDISEVVGESKLKSNDNE